MTMFQNSATIWIWQIRDSIWRQAPRFARDARFPWRLEMAKAVHPALQSRAMVHATGRSISTASYSPLRFTRKAPLRSRRRSARRLCERECARIDYEKPGVDSAGRTRRYVSTCVSTLRFSCGGRGGIRTHGGLPHARFRVECLKPDSATLPREKSKR